jgi:hypothetical protein
MCSVNLATLVQFEECAHIACAGLYWGWCLIPIDYMERELRYFRCLDIPSVLEADMPLECMIIRHYEVFLKLL